jgi:hypothetical protein
MCQVKTSLNAPWSPCRALIRRTSTLLISCALSLLAAACAHNVADAPSLQWRLDNAASAPDSSVAAAPSNACGGGTPSGWSARCYVFRGSDTDTGLALTQM